MTETVTANVYGEIVKCVCGNQVHTDGFYPCDPTTGQEIDEPYREGPWNGRSYVCSCGRVIDQTTLALNPSPVNDVDTHVLTVTHHHERRFD
jgi:hypothetical protein